MTQPAVAASQSDSAREYSEVRATTMRLASPLSPEDAVVQSMPDASPAKWHLAHTTWFFETFLLCEHLDGYEPFHAEYCFLFNSYYNAVGDRHPRPRRGMLTRPSLEEVCEYREHVDRGMHELLAEPPSDAEAQIHRVTTIGCHHEQQHQELLLTDVKHLFSCNSLRPAYRSALAGPSRPVSPMQWIAFEEGVREIGHPGGGFAYDNEGPRHRVYLEPFELADRLVTNGEFRKFVEDGGYERPELWLDEGWATVAKEGWCRPIYWMARDDGFDEFTLAGVRRLADAEPVSHVSYYEADAFARWAEARLATEAEWEVAAGSAPVEGNFADRGRLHPAPDAGGKGLRQAYGDVWQWTNSSYGPYPGYRAVDGALGEYNGKFMCGQYVLRGASCATSQSHARPTYRNFFYPSARWQFTGIRLARS